MWSVCRLPEVPGEATKQAGRAGPTAAKCESCSRRCSGGGTGIEMKVRSALGEGEKAPEGKFPDSWQRFGWEEWRGRAPSREKERITSSFFLPISLSLLQMFNCVPFTVPPIPHPWTGRILGRRRHVEGELCERLVISLVLSESEAVASSAADLARRPRIPLWGSLLHKRLSIAAVAGFVCCGGREGVRGREGELGEEAFRSVPEKMRHFSWDGVLFCRGGREGGMEEDPFLGANEVAFAVLTAACAACAVLSCVNAERGGKLGRHGGEQRT